MFFNCQPGIFEEHLGSATQIQPNELKIQKRQLCLDENVYVVESVHSDIVFKGL